MPPVIVAKDIYKAYPGFPPVLRGVNITVEPGEMVAIMGPSGCGKSTMLHILGMLHKPDAGTLDILQKNVLTFNSEQTAAFRRGNMGFVMQASNLFEHSTVFENVEFPLIYENVPPQERWERVIHALDLVRLSARVHYRSNRLSGGEQQRVAIARAMVNDPRILLADEPTGALDARTSAVIMENFRNLCHKGGVAMVMVTHDPKMAEYCDSIYTLEEGHLVCHKHEPPQIEIHGDERFMQQAPPLVRGALVAWRFPARKNWNISELASRMHKQGLLARIYALAGNSLLGSAQGYSLPLAVRRISFWQRVAGLRILWRRARGSISVWQLWKQLPKMSGFGSLRRRVRALVSGAILARWGLADNIEFFYAAGARKEAFATWVAAKLLSRPFAFAVLAEDMRRIGADCRARGKDAVFITCSTAALREAFLKRYADIPAEKVLLLPNPPLFAAGEEEADASTIMPGKETEVLCMAGPALKDILRAMIRLKKRGVIFRLAVLGNKSHRFFIWRSGLRKKIEFVSQYDKFAETFRNADVFIAQPAGELAMPWQLCEAMCLGRPLICVKITPGMAPAKFGENCLAGGTLDELEQNLEKLLKDAPLAAKLGERARNDMRNELNLQEATEILTDRMVMAAGAGDRRKNGGA